MNAKIYISIILFVNFSSVAISQNVPTKSFESYFLFQGRYPSGLSAVDWFPDDYEVQGVTNDGSNWFFTIVDQDKTHGIMWRIPKEVPLNGDAAGNPGVKSVNMYNVPELANGDHYHWGDPDHIKFNGVDYILVPIYSIVACFRANDLKYMNYANFDNNVSGGWCAIGIDNCLYGSSNNPSSVVKYEVAWEILTDENSNDHNALSYAGSYTLTKSGGSLLEMTDMQGGEFSNSGEILYLVSGRGACLEWLGIDGAEWTPKDGIHAIATENWREIDHSTKSSESNVYFSYNYDPTCIICTIIVPVGGGTDTPEGLTVWDLEDESSNIRGGLHVLVDRYLFGGTNCDDELFFHHYSANIYVDNDSSGGQGLLGEESNPFNDFTDAYNYYPIWNGAKVILKAGSYNDTGLYNKRILITSEGGAAIIGQ